MLKFKSVDCVKGPWKNSTIYTGPAPQDMDRGAARAGPRGIYGPHIEVDGVVRELLGFEMFCLGDERPVREGEGLGVCVRALPGDAWMAQND